MSVTFGRRLPAVMAGLAMLSCGCTSAADQEPRGMPTQPSSRPTGSTSLVDLTRVASRAAHAATSLPDGRVLVTGGCVVDGCVTATDETFVVSADGLSATAGPAMSAARDNHTAVVLLDGRVVLHGGFAGEGQGVLALVDVVDPAAGTVEPQDPLSQARGGHAAVLLGDGRVLVAGGWVSPHMYSATVEVFDATTGATQSAADLPYAADALDAVLLADGRVLVTGGQVAPAQATNAAAIFDPVAGSWSDAGPLRVPRLKHFSVLLPDGRVLVMGGTSDDQTILPSTEIFDPVSETFTLGPDMSEPRYKFPGGAIVLDDGRVVVAGGGRTVEVIDLAANASQVVRGFSGQRSFATLNRLGSGDLLVLGGYDDRIHLPNEFQLIAPDTIG